MQEITAYFETLMDENVLYPVSITAVSSVVTICAILVAYKVLFRKKEQGLSSSHAEKKHNMQNKKKEVKLQKDNANDDDVNASEAEEDQSGDDKDENEESEEDEPPALETNSNRADPMRDPFEYCGHIQGEVKKIRQNLAAKKIQQDMTEDQINEEREAQRRQLEAIFSMMAEENEKFGIQSLDDIQKQMGLYV